MNEELKKYYEYLKSVSADVPEDYESFATTLSDEAQAKTYFDYLKANNFDAPDTYDSFSETLGLKKKDLPLESAAKGETIIQGLGQPSKEPITPPLQLESEKPKDRETKVVGDALRALKGASLRALGGITATPNFLARTLSAFTIRPFVKAQGGTDEDARAVTDALMGASAQGQVMLGGAKAQEKLNKLATKTEEKMFPIEGNIVQNLKDLEFGKAGESLLRGVSQSVPYLAMTAATAGAGTPAVLATIGATSAAQQYAETEGKAEGKRILNGWLYGGFEAAGELVTAGIVNGIGKAYKQGVIKEVNEKFIQGAAKQVAKDFGLEGSSEAATQIGQNLTDIITGVDPNRKIFDNVLDATLIGGVMGGGLGITNVAASALGRAIASPKEVQQVQDNVQQQQVLIDQIESTDNPAVQTALKDRLKTLQDEANQVIDQNTQIVDNLTTEEKTKVGELFSVANDLQSKIDNNEVDEQEAPVIEKTIEGINEQIEAIKEEVLTKLEEESKATEVKESEDIIKPKEVVSEPQEEVVPIVDEKPLVGDITSVLDVLNNDKEVITLKESIDKLKKERTSDLISNGTRNLERWNDEIGAQENLLEKRRNAIKNRHALEIKELIDNGTIESLVVDNKITAEKAQNIINETGFDVPQTIKDRAIQDKKDKENDTSSILGRTTDFFGKPKDEWMIPLNDVGVRDQETSDYIKGHIKKALEKNKYPQAISEGRMTANDAKYIIESAGLKVPKDISSLIPKDAKTVLKDYLNDWGETTLRVKDNFVKEVKQDFDMVLTKLRNMDLIKTDCIG